MVFQNPRNSAERVTVTEVECDHSCTWEAAIELAGSQEGLRGFFCFRGDHTHQLFLVIPIDAARVRIVYPHRFSGGIYAAPYIVSRCLKMVPGPANMAVVQKNWNARLAQAVARREHLEQFALLNGSVFSLWFNVRKALDPGFNPDTADSDQMHDEMQGTGGRRRGRGHDRYNFQPNVKIQLLTTSDGKKLGGIRLSTTRPNKHCCGMRWNGARWTGTPWNKECNKARHLEKHGRKLASNCSEYFKLHAEAEMDVCECTRLLNATPRAVPSALPSPELHHEHWCSGSYRSGMWQLSIACTHCCCRASYRLDAWQLCPLLPCAHRLPQESLPRGGLQ